MNHRTFSFCEICANQWRVNPSKRAAAMKQMLRYDRHSGICKVCGDLPEVKLTIDMEPHGTGYALHRVIATLTMDGQPVSSSCSVSELRSYVAANPNDDGAELVGALLDFFTQPKA